MNFKSMPSRLTAVFFAATLGACSGSNPGPTSGQTSPIGNEVGSDTLEQAPSDSLVQGQIIDGPVAEASLSAYSLSSESFGGLADTGATDINGKITGLDLAPSNAPYLLISEGGTDISTGEAPLLSTLKTIITADNINSGTEIYTTPLTTVAADMFFQQAALGPYDADTLLNESRQKVLGSIGFGLGVDFDIFTTPPVILDATAPDELQAIMAYRAAIESLADALEAASQNTQGSSDPQSANDLLSVLGSDLADGVIDGVSSGFAIAALADALLNVEIESTPAVTQQDISELLASDAAKTGVEAPAVIANNGDLDDNGITLTIAPGAAETDSDGDGTSDINDEFPFDPTEAADTDLDGIGDNADNCPVDANAGQEDLDADNIGDACDFDRDNDGSPNAVDAFPDDPFETTDSDGDNVGDNSDNCPTNANPGQEDLDADRIGDACDFDRDNDGTPNEFDAFPDDPSRN